MRKRWILLLAYLALLAASHLYRALEPAAERPADRLVVRVAEVDAQGQRLDQRVELSYQEWAPTDWRSRGEGGKSVVVMLHGSPGSSGDFFGLGPAVGETRRVLAPDLPGFGFSTQRLASYSIRAHAEYVREMLDELGVDRFDVVGFSMGGGVGLHLAELEPRRTRSMTLLSSIGVQEMELLGNYQLNHAIHALQLWCLWALQEIFPHFGALDGSVLSLPYARNFYETDQRPLRTVLEQLDMPTLILHGDDDPLVPLAAAMEHHRIVPQSRLALFDGDHFMLFTRFEELAKPLGVFLDEVDAGTAPKRAQAEPDRQIASERPFDPAARQPASGVSVAIIMLLLAAATLVSEDLACIAAGLLAAQGALGLIPAIIGCFVGIVMGDIALYWSGRLIGSRALAVPPLCWILSEARVAKSAAWFERRGALVILLTRFVPGTRLPTYFSAGLLKTGFLRFSFYFLIAAAIWTPLLVVLASLVGQRVFGYFEVFQRNALLGVLATATIVWSLIKLTPVVLTWRGRRLAVGAWRRWTHWEFWPWWLFYLPILVRVLWLGIRYRSPTLFTLANPGIECGGFAGESKSDLLRQMPADVLPSWRLLDSPSDREARRGAMWDFLERARVEPPFVLKPDSGERGRDVLIARSLGEAESYLLDKPGPTLLQDYVEGSEFGVFYVRHPGEYAGRVTSIAAKILPRIVGDGRSTLEQLILSNERTVCQAPFFLAAHEGSLESVPEAGEEVSLGDLGTHSRGAMFLDANHLRTPELDEALERIASGIDGFYFGRFDLRTPSGQHLLRGEGLRVLVLNGVTSEEAHMYDPRHGVFFAWRTLGAQWRTAFEIGDANRRRGMRPGSIRALIRTLRHRGEPPRTAT